MEKKYKSKFSKVINNNSNETVENGVKQKRILSNNHESGNNDQINNNKINESKLKHRKNFNVASDSLGCFGIFGIILFLGIITLVVVSICRGPKFGRNDFLDMGSPTICHIPEKYKMIKNNTFNYWGNNSLQEIYMPSVRRIGNRAFVSCNGLYKVFFSSSLRVIGSNAFRDCDELISIRLPEGVKKIKNHAFYGCNNLETIYIPSTVKSFGIYVFENCKNLKEIHISKSSPVYDEVSKWYGEKIVKY